MKKILFLIVVLCLFAISTFAQVYSGLDPTFGNNGAYTIDSCVFNNIVVQSDKRITILGGKYYIMRLFEKGTIDQKFTNNSMNIIQPFSAQSFNTICLQPDGRILLGGGTAKDLLLIRLKTDGNLDSSFGNNGIKITGYPGYEYINSIALQPDGKIVSVGIRQTPEDAIQVVRYLPDGSLDSSFGNNGEVYYDWTWGVFHYPTANDISVLPNGKIVVGATTQIDANGKYCFTALRLLPNGSLDTSFNHSGMAYTDIGGWLAYCKAMQLQPDGKILLAGHSDSITVVRFDTTGKLDNSFGSGGMARLSPGSGNALVLQTGGKILIGGSSADTAFLICRLLPNGSPDNSFGNQGKISTKVLDKKNTINGLAVQQDGKILACGEGEKYPWPNNYSTAVLLRYNENATGVEEMQINQNVFRIHPNPATDRLTIAYPNDQGVIVDVCVYDVTGRKLVSKESQYFKSSSVTITVSTFAPGVYFISITNHKGLSEQFKFVKQ
ncbi:MAG: T9SS type A sorting domain-containing protein [Bacteroidetes bacterium]|nr:T9SS type A sorting domain-containing protein [Bacteroidota bacterium]